jgi:hypothetical protein
MPLLAIFWAAYVPFVTLLLSIVLKSVLRALRSLVGRSRRAAPTVALPAGVLPHRRRPGRGGSRRGQVVRTGAVARLRRTRS